MKRGNLRWNEEAFAAFCGKRSRFAAGTINGQEADAATDPTPRAIATDGPTGVPGGADAASKPTATLVALCRAHGLPEPIPEFRFHASRKWRADYCWPDQRIIVEIDGGIWTGGRHSGGTGQLRDMEKLNAAALLGFLVLRYTPQQMGQCMEDLTAMFGHA